MLDPQIVFYRFPLPPNSKEMPTMHKNSPSEQNQQKN